MNEDKNISAPTGDSKMRQMLLFISGIGILGLAAFFLITGGSVFTADVPPVTNVQVTPAIPSAQQTNPIEPELAGAVQVGAVAPDFSLVDLDGNQHTLESLRGRPVIVNFWATWCAPCRVEMPEFEEALTAYADDDLVLLAVNREEDIATIERFLTEEDLFMEERDDSFFPLLDSTAKVADGYGVFNMPTTYFLDANGTVSAVHRGPLARVQLEDYMEQTLNPAASN